MALLEGLEGDEILDKLRYYPGILLANWKVWPILQLVSELTCRLCIFTDGLTSLGQVSGLYPSGIESLLLR